MGHASERPVYDPASAYETTATRTAARETWCLHVEGAGKITHRPTPLEHGCVESRTAGERAPCPLRKMLTNALHIPALRFDW
jgi:hypothetical protein